MKRLLLFTFLALSVFCLANANADEHPPITYAELSEKSDVVCIVTFDSSRLVDEKIDDPTFKDSDPSDYYARCSTFKVAAALKGTLDGDSIELVHYNYAAKAKRPEDGPHFLNFDKPNPVWEEFTFKPPKGIEYLVFLKKRSDGKYIPAAGQRDMLLSVRRVESAD